MYFIALPSDKYETKFKGMTREMNNLKLDHMNLLTEFDKVFKLNQELTRNKQRNPSNNSTNNNSDVEDNGFNFEQVQVSNTNESSDSLQIRSLAIGSPVQTRMVRAERVDLVQLDKVDQIEKAVSNEVNNRLVELEEEFEKRIDMEKDKQRALRLENEQMEMEFNEKLFEAGQTIQMLNDQLQDLANEKDALEKRFGESKFLLKESEDRVEEVVVEGKTAKEVLESTIRELNARISDLLQEKGSWEKQNSVIFSDLELCRADNERAAEKYEQQLHYLDEQLKLYQVRNQE